MGQNYLIVHQSGYQDRAYPLHGEDILVGRAADATLTLPNVSVSRQHTRILQREESVFALDLGSENGTLINHEPLIPGEERKLATGDLLQVGKFRLTFIASEGQSHPVFKGRFVHHLPVYEANIGRPQEDATFGLDVNELYRMAEQEHVIESARIIESGSAARRWKPEKKEMVIGKGAEINATGWFISSRAATVSWGGRAHDLQAHVWWTRVFVNGERITGKHTLRNGDRIRVGNELFLYEVPPSERLDRMKQRQGGRREQVQIPSAKKGPPPAED